MNGSEVDHIERYALSGVLPTSNEVLALIARLRAAKTERDGWEDAARVAGRELNVRIRDHQTEQAEIDRLREGLRRLKEQDYHQAYCAITFAEAVLEGYEPGASLAAEAERTIS